jgi:hypothetical protein
MEIITSVGECEYPFDYQKSINIKKLSKFNSSTKLFLGWAWIAKKSFNDSLKNYQNCKKYFLNVVSPCDLLADTSDFQKFLKNMNCFDKVFIPCPYTVDYLNNISQTNRYNFTFFPNYSSYLFDMYSENNYNNLKIYEVCYIGSILSKEHLEILKIIKNFKHFVVSWQKKSFRNFFKWPFFINFLGFKSNQEKWDLLSKCKIQVATNLLYLNRNQVENFTKNANPSFKYYDYAIKNRTLPQIKSRCIESFSTKSLLLLKHDKWNVIEEWFKPNEDFIYWYDYKDLKEKISYISSNFSKYSHIVTNAHNKVKKFYFENFFHNLENI